MFVKIHDCENSRLLKFTFVNIFHFLKLLWAAPVSNFIWCWGYIDMADAFAVFQQVMLSGFLVGVGKGMAGSFVKPISKVGQAISDVGSGIAAQATPDSASMKRRRARLRRRQPRLLFGQGALRPWSELEAELLGQLGERLTQGVEEVIPLAQQGSQRAVLLLYLRHMLLAEVKMQESVAQIS